MEVMKIDKTTQLENYQEFYEPDWEEIDEKNEERRPRDRNEWMSNKYI